MADIVLNHSESALIHGVSWHVSHRFTDVADAASVDILVVTDPGVELFIVGEAVADGKAYIDIYEGATVSASGTELTQYNRSRGSAKTNGSTIYHTPTVTDTGTVISYGLMAGGEAPGHRSIGGAGGIGADFIFKGDTIYLFRITNKSGSASDISIHLDTWDK